MKKWLFIPLSVAIVSCQSGQTGKAEKDTFSIDSVKAHILKMNESYSQRFTTKDTAYFNSRYCKDAQVYSPGMPAVVGRDSIISFFYQNGANTATKIELPVPHVYGNKELVIEDGTYNFPDGKGGSVDKGKFIALWKEEAGIWKLYREMWNTDLQPNQ